MNNDEQLINLFHVKYSRILFHLVEMLYLIGIIDGKEGISIKQSIEKI